MPRYTAESAAGWQQVNFARPVPIQANTTYVASYHTDTGNYGYNHGYFAGADIANDPLHAPGNGANGVYTCGPSALPTRTYRASNS